MGVLSVESVDLKLGEGAAERLMAEALDGSWEWEREEGCWVHRLLWGRAEAAGWGGVARALVSEAVATFAEEGERNRFGAATPAALAEDLVRERLECEQWWEEERDRADRDAVGAAMDAAALALGVDPLDAEGADEEGWLELLWSQEAWCDVGAGEVLAACRYAVAAEPELDDGEADALLLGTSADPDDLDLDGRAPFRARGLPALFRAAGASWLQAAEPGPWEDRPCVVAAMAAPEALRLLGHGAPASLAGDGACEAALRDPGASQVPCPCGPVDRAGAVPLDGAWSLRLLDGDPGEPWDGPGDPEGLEAGRALAERLEACRTVGEAAGTIAVAKDMALEGSLGAAPAAMAALGAGVPWRDLVAPGAEAA